MVELRKRPAPPPAPPPAKKKAAPKPKFVKGDVSAEETKAAPAAAVPDAPVAAAPLSKEGPPKTGENVALEGFGGEVETNDGNKVTLAKLVDDSKAGVVLFTYPKASTPGCKS